MKFLRSLLRKELERAKRERMKKDLAKKEDPLDDDMMAGHTDNGPKPTQSTR